MEARNLTYMFYGFMAAWLIVLLYVVSLARRGARLNREVAQLRQMVARGEETEAAGPGERVR